MVLLETSQSRDSVVGDASAESAHFSGPARTVASAWKDAVRTSNVAWAS